MSGEKDADFEASLVRRAQHRERIERLFDRRGVGDIDGVMALLAPDVVCFPQRPPGGPTPTPIHGWAAAREILRQRLVNYESFPSTLHRILIDADQVVTHRTCRLRERGSGPVRTFDCIVFFRFRDGLIVEYFEFLDGDGQSSAINYPY